MFTPQPGSWIEVMPAYGRDYKNQKDAKADWNADKDFIETASRRSTNKTDCRRMGLKVIIRYSDNLKVMQAPMN